jgi:hypothetical protein
MCRYMAEANRQAGSKAKLAITAQGNQVSNALGRRRKSVRKCQKASAIHQDEELAVLLLRGDWCLETSAAKAARRRHKAISSPAKEEPSSRLPAAATSTPRKRATAQAARPCAAEPSVARAGTEERRAARHKACRAAL